MVLSAATGRLDGLRILAVEDEFLLAIALEADLGDAGAQIVGPFNNLQSGIEAARKGGFDLAVLDVNLDGMMIYPLADELLARGIPFLFLSGYVAASMPARFAAVRRVAKPHDASRLIEEIRALALA